jgi:signal transduction histidine kinase
MSPESRNLIFAVAIVCFALLFMAVFLVFLIHKNYKAKAEKINEIFQAIFKTQEEERNRISFDLHDDINPSLKALDMHSVDIKNETTNTKIIDLIDVNSKTLDDIIIRIKAIIRNQSSTYIYANGLESELILLINRYSHYNNIKFDFSYNVTMLNINKEFLLNQFRICQELLHNSIKHSSCSHIEIKFRNDFKHFYFFYSDNGKGTEIKTSGISGMGLQNIQTRSSLFSGEIKFLSNPGGGFCCKIDYPIKKITDKS